MIILRNVRYCALLAVFHAAACVCTIAQGPLPAQLTTAQTAFLSNAGAFDNVRAVAAYNDMYQALGSWKRFQLTSKPSDAELVFEVSLFARPASLASAASTILRLRILDTKTQVLLWTLDEPVNGGATEGFIATAVTKLVADLNALIADSFNPSTPKKARFQQDKPPL